MVVEELRNASEVGRRGFVLGKRGEDAEGIGRGVGVTHSVVVVVVRDGGEGGGCGSGGGVVVIVGVVVDFSEVIGVEENDVVFVELQGGGVGGCERRVRWDAEEALGGGEFALR